MHKSRLQELCHRNFGRLPEYETTRDGPDHNPRFRATVTVDGRSFHSQYPASSAKEAQNLAAQLAVEHFISALPAPAPPPPRPIDDKIAYKSQLQSLVQKRNLDPPVYESIREGRPNCLRFKAIVRVDGQMFESCQYFDTLREAEHSAARAALLSLPLDDGKEQEPGFFKNLLQELTQKEKLSLPNYTTFKDGASHMPLFSSKVEVQGEIFEGDVARSKKQAEMNAAMVAWYQLKERRVSRLSAGHCSSSKFEGAPSTEYSISTTEVVKKNLPQLSSGLLLTCKSEDPPSPESSINTIEVVEDMPELEALSAPLSSVKLREGLEDIADTNKAMDKDIATTADGSSRILPPPVDAETFLRDKTMEVIKRVDVPVKSDNHQGRNSMPSSESTRSNNPVAAPDAPKTAFPVEKGCSLLSNRVRVYPRKPDLVLPDGATVLPFSDDMWVAVSLDFLEGGISA